MFDTILFDMDGTLIDTEGYYNRCWVQAIQEAGYKMTPKRALELRSLGRPYAPEWFQRNLGPDANYQAIRSRRKELMNHLLETEGLRLKPGVVPLLDTIRKKGMRAVIVTATDLERTTDYLGRLQIADRFDRIICAGMVERGKPAPDIYRYACEQVQRSPKECLAVEDSPNGVKSAAAAGCRVVMVPDQSEPDEELMRLIERKAGSLDELRHWLEDGDFSGSSDCGSL